MSQRALLVAGEQQAFALGVLEDGGVTEVILLGGLDAEGTLGPHAQHRLVDVQRPHVLQLRQADVQRAEGTLGTMTAMVSATNKPSLALERSGALPPTSCLEKLGRGFSPARQLQEVPRQGQAPGRLDSPPHHHHQHLHPVRHLSCRCQRCSAPRSGGPQGDP